MTSAKSSTSCAIQRCGKSNYHIRVEEEGPEGLWHVEKVDAPENPDLEEVKDPIMLAGSVWIEFDAPENPDLDFLGIAEL